MVEFGQNLLYSSKVVLFGLKCLYSGKSGCNRAKWLYLVKMVVFGQSGCIVRKSGSILPEWLLSGKSDYIRAK